jgi:hypothetical protein
MRVGYADRKMCFVLQELLSHTYVGVGLYFISHEKVKVFLIKHHAINTYVGGEVYLHAL